VLTGTSLLTGAEAVAHAMRQIDPDVVPVYPITPQTPMVEAFAKMVADGACRTELVNVESEHSAMSAAVGSALAGARTITATSSQGLALMAEVVYIAAAMRAPVVVALGNRALSGPINIHGDHSDSMLIRDSGVLQLFAESAQEAYDLMIAAPRIAERQDVLLPVFVCQDGFTVTHSAEPVELLPDEVVDPFVGDYRVPYPLFDLDRITTQGPFAMPDSYFEHKRDQELAIEAAILAVADVADELRELTGRKIRLVEAYRLEDAERAIVLLGASAGTVKDVVDELRVAGERVGLLRICCYRPFPNEEIRLALAGMRTVAVLDRALAPGARPPLLTEVAASLYGSRVMLRSYVYGLGGRDLFPQDVRRVYADLTAGGSRRSGYLGLKESS